MRSHRLTQSSPRSGLTLLEVILSTAIFLGALTAILKIMSIGHDSRVSAKLDAEAVIRCESVMGQLVSGMMELSDVADQPFETEGSENWYYTIEIGDGGATDLLLVSVRVEFKTNDLYSGSSFTLVRAMRDPQLFLDAALSSMESEEDLPE